MFYLLILYGYAYSLKMNKTPQFRWMLSHKLPHQVTSFLEVAIHSQFYVPFTVSWHCLYVDLRKNRKENRILFTCTCYAFGYLFCSMLLTSFIYLSSFAFSSLRS